MLGLFLCKLRFHILNHLFLLLFWLPPLLLCIATIALICLCLQNRYITNVIVIIDIMEDVNVKIFTILLRKKFLLGENVCLVCLLCNSKISLTLSLHM